MQSLLMDLSFFRPKVYYEGEEETNFRRSSVFIASFLRYLHCGRYPWLWNDEHVLVLLAVV